MTFIQRIQPAGDERCDRDGHAHDPHDCCVIDCITTEPVLHHQTREVIHPAGTIVWHSHMEAAIHPEHRLNPDCPAEDHRGAKPKPVKVTPWCPACKTHPAAPAS